MLALALTLTFDVGVVIESANPSTRAELGNYPVKARNNPALPTCYRRIAWLDEASGWASCVVVCRGVWVQMRSTNSKTRWKIAKFHSALKRRRRRRRGKYSRRPRPVRGHECTQSQFASCAYQCSGAHCAGCMRGGRGERTVWEVGYGAYVL